MDDPNTNGDEPRLVLTPPGVRIVLAEADAPGSLHYLLEGEGFQVVGCASDEQELGRVLGQGLQPDVIVLDADIVATSVLVARELAPDAHVIAIWPDAVQPPPGGERVDPRLVYEELGPAIRRHMDRKTVPVPVIAMPREEPVMAAAVTAGAAASVATDASVGESSVFARAASRMSVLSVTLITAILFTMGVSFALGGFHWYPNGGPPRLIPMHPIDPATVDTSDPVAGRVPPSLSGDDSGGTSPTHQGGGGDPHNSAGGFGDVVITTGGGTGGDDGSAGGSPSEGTGSGDQGTTGDQGSTGEGDQGGGQGDQGGGQGGDQGGDHGAGGGQGDQGGDHGGGGGQGDQGGDHGGGGGQGDEGGDDQGEDEQGGDQGDDQGDEDGDSQGDQDDHGPHGDDHGAHSDTHGDGDEQD